MTPDKQDYNQNLEDTLVAAADGNTEAIRQFFVEFLTGPLYIPERYQSKPLSNAPEYPNDFVSILGVDAGERTVIPAFTKATSIEQWCGNPLSYKKLSGADLLKQVPEQWWLILNPSSEVEKELSPWEITRLKDGERAIPELVSELSLDNSANQPLNVKPLEDDELETTRQILISSGEKHAEIESLYILKQQDQTEDQSKLPGILIGIAVSDTVEQSDFDTVQKKVEDAVAPTLIGSANVRYFTGYSLERSMMLGIFKGSEPLYKQIATDCCLFNKAGKFIRSLFSS